MRKYFITGTDTDCGKTYVTCKLLRFFNNQGLTAQALKPVASGCTDFISEDVLALQQDNYHSEQIINRWSFVPPISPHLAAQQCKEQLSVQRIADFCQQECFQTFDRLLIEGAGGLMVPLNDHETWVAFVRLLSIPVILVVGMRLGCLNHALLTAEILKLKNLPCVGWIANCIDNNMLFLDENIATLSRLMPFPLLTTVNYGGVIENIAERLF